jgi:MSHA biogenesis protein MshL
MLRLFSLLPLLGLLAACTAPQPRPDVVRDRIGEELALASAGRQSAAAAERALLMPLTVEMPRQEYHEPRFDLSVVDAPATQVFMALVTGTRYNMLVGPEVAGSITVNLKDVTVREALESIRELYGYEFNIRGNRISIQPHTLQTRVFQVNYLAMTRKGDSTLTVGSSQQYSGTTTTGQMVGSAQQSSGGVGAQSAQQSAYDPSGSNVRTDNNIDFWSELEKALVAIVSEEATTTPPSSSAPKVIVNKVSGTVVVRARPRDLRLVEEYLNSSRLFVQRQVMLEAKILEVRLTEGSQAGINWSSFNGVNNRFSAGVVQPGTLLRTPPGMAVELTTPPPVGVLNRTDEIISNSGTFLPGKAGLIAASALGKGFVGLAFQSANFAALLNFLETQGSVSVLSSPRVATLNNQKAMLKVGTDEVYVSGFIMAPSTSTTGTNTTTTTSVPSPQTARLFSGISLDVTPQIDEDGNIVLHVHPAISTVREVQKTFNLGSAGIVTLPLASREVNETDSIVRVQDGNIVAIGGMMHQYQSSDRSGLPGTTGSAFGVLTGQRGSQSYKSEMVILLKPTIIHDDRAWMKDIEQSGERVRNLGLPPLSVPLQ